MADGIYFNERTKTYDIPISHLDFKYLNSCSDVDELEKIMKTLRSGEVGRYVELESCCEERIKLLNPRSRVLRKTIEPIKITQLDKEERCQVEQDFQSWLDEMKSLNEEYNAEESDENGYHHLSAKTKKKINSEIEADINDEALEEKFLKYDNEDLPPVRRTVVFHDEPAIRVYSSGDNTFGRRVLKPRDYSEWDKLEKVWDKELEEENQTICKPERGEIMNLSEVETRGLTKLDYKELASRVANIPIQTRQKLAEREKDKGNESFKSGDYADALNYYKRSLIIYETTTVYNNRAIVYLRQKQWNHAVNDCTNVLKVEPDNLKALFRRGQANFELHNLEQAEKDLERLTDQDPTNFKAQNLLRNVRIAKSKREKPHLEGSRRMVITDVGDSSDSSSSEDDEVEQKGEHDDEQKHQSATMVEKKLSEIKLPINDISGTNHHGADDEDNNLYNNVIIKNTEVRLNSEDTANPKRRNFFDESDIFTDETKTLVTCGEDTQCSEEIRKPSMNREVSVEINDTYSISDYETLKQEGNNSFKKGDMQLALKYFDKCIQVCLKNNLHKDKRLAIIYRNRSLIHLQTNEYRLALNDCTLALSIEPNCPIATYRKAMALKFLGDYVNCIQNLEKAKDLCPTNNKIIEELNKVKYMLAQKARLNTETSINHSKALGTSTMNATSDIEIVELPNVVIGEEEDEHREVEVVDEDDDDYDRLSTIQYDKIASSSYNTADVSKKHLSDTSPTCKPIDADWEVVNLVKQQNERNTTIKTMNITSSIVKHTIENKQITTPHEFQTCWIDIQHLKKSNVADATNRIITLLDSISSEQLPKLIGIRMEAEMLDDLLTAIDVKMKTENGNDLQIYEILINLSKTERFDCALFLINEQTVQAIKNILARFHHNQELKQDQVEQLQLIYSL